MNSPELREYLLDSVTVDGRLVPTANWASVRLPSPAAAGALIVPTGVCNNPRFRVLSVDGEEWVTEDTGIRTMEWCVDDAARAVTELTVECFAGTLRVREDGDVVTVRNGDVITVLREALAGGTDGEGAPTVII